MQERALHPAQAIHLIFQAKTLVKEQPPPGTLKYIKITQYSLGNIAAITEDKDEDSDDGVEDGVEWERVDSESDLHPMVQRMRSNIRTALDSRFNFSTVDTSLQCLHHVHPAALLSYVTSPK